MNVSAVFEKAEPLYAWIILGTILLFIGLMTRCETLGVPGFAGEQRGPLEAGEVAAVQNPVWEDGFGNSEFAQAQPATLPDDGEFVINGAIETPGDIDVFMLGPVAAGDAIVVDVSGLDGLNAVAAVFDGESNLIDANNDRSYYSGNLDPMITLTIREDTSNLYLGIAASTATAFATSSGTPTGAYTIRLSRRPGGTMLTPRQQLVWLDFEGGETLQIGSEPAVTMNPFSAEAMSSRFAGQTDHIIGLLIAHMQQDLAPFDVVLLNSKHHSPPTQPHSRLYFGNFNADYLGLADSVDEGNESLEQIAIIFSEDISMFENLQPTAEEAALALANTAAHELGHLLGLEHTSESGDLMASVASARLILEINAKYGRARLELGIFPAGWQASPELLLLNVGASQSNVAQSRLSDSVGATKQSTFRNEAGMPDIILPICNRCSDDGCLTSR